MTVSLVEYRGRPALRKTKASFIDRQARNYQQLQQLLTPAEYKKYFIRVYNYDGEGLFVEYLPTDEWVTLRHFWSLDPSGYSIYPLVKNLLACVALLQSHRVAHGDLHDQNVLITKDGKVRVIDLEEMRVGAASDFELQGDMDSLWSLLYFIFEHTLDLEDKMKGVSKHEVVRYLVGIDIAHYETIDPKKFTRRARQLNFYRTPPMT